MRSLPTVLFLNKAVIAQMAARNPPTVRSANKKLHPLLIPKIPDSETGAENHQANGEKVTERNRPTVG